MINYQYKKYITFTEPRYKIVLDYNLDHKTINISHPGIYVHTIDSQMDFTKKQENYFYKILPKPFYKKIEEAVDDHTKRLFVAFCEIIKRSGFLETHTFDELINHSGIEKYTLKHIREDIWLLERCINVYLEYDLHVNRILKYDKT